VVFAFLAGAERPGGWTAAGLALVLGSLWVVLRTRALEDTLQPQPPPKR